MDRWSARRHCEDAGCAPGEHLVEIFPAGAAGGEPAVKVTVTIDSDQESVVTFDVDGAQPTQVRARPAAGG